MKFYYGDKLIRTSKNHVYTHAVLSPEGKTFTCSSSREGAEKTLRSKISWWREGAQNLQNAIKAIKAGRTTYTVKEGRNTYTARVTGTLECYQKQIQVIEGIIAGYRSYQIVELEARP